MNQSSYTTVNTAVNAANMAANSENMPPQPYPQPAPPPVYGYSQSAQPYTVQSPAYAPQQAQPYYPQIPAYPPQQAAPGFAIRYKDPRKTGAVRTLNIMGLLLVAQLALTFLLQSAVTYGCMAAGFNISGSLLAQMLLAIALSPIGTASPFLFYMLVGKKDWNWHLRFERLGFFSSLLTIFAGLGVCMAANFPAGLVDELLGDLGAKKLPSVLGQGGGWLNFIVEFLGVAVLVPMMEEFAFRGVLLSSLRRYGTGFAIAASGFIFGLAHMSLTSVVFATISGIALGIAYVLTGNLWVTVFIHALNNGIVVVESYSRLFVSESNRALLEGGIMLGSLVLGCLCLALLLIFRKRCFPRKAPQDAAQLPPLRFGESLACMLKSPVLWSIVAMVLMENALLFL